ncbi:hypothetical protein K469DRAFT_713069 [Zopfia rhizophila CBS 207.26]|uniref:Uncharacterized protein n=1 Tax=Zopfia rhizophila CBS 207.26 TaxID=1314779 RepID=A0A6A6DT54_9PEZI|nr:hypothetical protein K469DRAFT_713069 [Zopfia rhizophila CBS 207.26]
MPQASRRGPMIPFTATTLPRVDISARLVFYSFTSILSPYRPQNPNPIFKTQSCPHNTP